MLRAIKLRLLAMLPPAVFLLITGYFAWNTVHGTRGLEAQARERLQLSQAQQEFALTDRLRNQWEMRVAALSDRSIAGDMLDDQSRQVLNLANPADLVVQLPAAAASAGSK